MKAKKDHSPAVSSPDLLYMDEQQIAQEYEKFQQPPHEYVSNNNQFISNTFTPTLSNYIKNGLMEINHEQQQTHLELSNFV